MKYRFDKIAFNSTAKKTPTESDKEHYIGLEHIDGECLEITRWGSDVAPIGEKLIMKKGDVLFGKRRAYQENLPLRLLMASFLLMEWCFDQTKKLLTRTTSRSS